MAVSNMLLGLLALAAVQTEDWVQVTGDEEQAIWYYDRGRISADGDVLTIFIRADHSNEPGAEYRTSTHNLVIDCVAGRYRRISTIRHRADGSVYNRYDESDRTFIPIGPETVLADLAQAMCALPR